MSTLGAFSFARARAGAIVYDGRPAHDLLAAFARDIAGRGFAVGGLIQRNEWDAAGNRTDMRLEELDTGRSISIHQRLGRDAGCTVDPQGVAESSGALRRALAARVDLLVVNKFSHLEAAGGGLADEMLAAMAEGIPLLTAVPAEHLGRWTQFCGGACDLLPPEPAAPWRWWGPWRLYRDLALGVAEVPARRVVVGLNWTLVEGPDGVGLAHTPPRGTPGCRALAGGWEGRSLRALALLLGSWDPVEAAIGLAAVNAHYNRFDLAAEAVNGLDVLAGGGGLTVVVGGFPGVRERLPGCVVVERVPEPGDYPDPAAEWLLPGAESVVVTASALGNRSLPRLLAMAQDARVALVGPGTPLTPRLFGYGVAVLSGLVAGDPDALARAVAEGAGARLLKKLCREATLRA